MVKDDHTHIEGNTHKMSNLCFYRFFFLLAFVENSFVANVSNLIDFITI